MNIRNTFFVVALFLSSVACAQVTKKSGTTPSKKNQHLNVFNQSITSGDAASAILALNYYISEQGDNNPYTDTLAMLYLQQSAYPQCYYWVEKRLAVKPEDNNLLEMKGVCLDKLNEPKESIAIFEKLFKKTQNPFHAYKLLELQYGIKRLSEAVSTAEAAEKLVFKPEYTMTYSVGQQMGRTYLQSSIYNIHGLALYDLGNKEEAKKYFEKALQLDTSFALAKQNLEAIRSLEGPGNKVNAGVTTPSASPANKPN
ncbi:MAG: tetratricopeptide repeat protein [Bacteroidota bacterium]